MKIHTLERHRGVATSGKSLASLETRRVRDATFDGSPRHYRRVALDGGGGA